jgi:catechol 2,3-dioxygenase-like lactoylglutathione lyase family enzyme
MVRTHGLTHIALRVHDVDRSFRFYQTVLGMAEVYRGDDFIQAQTPDTWDVVVFEQASDRVSGDRGLGSGDRGPGSGDGGPGFSDRPLEEDVSRVESRSPGIAHFGFRVVRPEDVAEVAADVVRAGGRVTSTGEFVPGEPYVFFTDLDGNEVEAWYELPTPLDPPSLDRAD